MATTAAPITWHLHEAMARAGVRTARALHEALAPYELELSYPQVARLVSGTPARLNLAFLAAACDLLGCGPGDLLRQAAGAREPGEAGRP